jgi:hypothetical protein
MSKFCFKTAKTATEAFQLSMVTMLSIIHVFFNGMQDFGTAVKITGMNTVDDLRTPDVIETARELISTDCQMSLQMIEEELEIG